MSTITYDVQHEETRNRMTVAFRIILAIPHLIVSQVWGRLAQVLGVVQWFMVVFTGKRNEGIWNMQRSWLDYDARVTGYVGLMYDPYPAFGTDPGTSPARTAMSFEEPADRLTNALRIIWAIPALVITVVVSIGSAVVVLISWFAIVITGKQSRGMWDFVLKVQRFVLQTESYVLLMTDTYPKFGEGAMADSSTPPPPPPPPPVTSFIPPPPPAM